MRRLTMVKYSHGKELAPFCLGLRSYYFNIICQKDLDPLSRLPNPILFYTPSILLTPYQAITCDDFRPPKTIIS